VAGESNVQMATTNEKPVSVMKDPKDLKFTLLVPTLNEIVGMKAIMPLIKREWVDQIIIADGGSTDGTVEYAKEQGYTVFVQKQRGIRAAYIEALPLVTGDIIITFSPDGNSIPELIVPLVAKMREGYDLVIVSRYFQGAKSADDDFLTGFGNWFFTKIVNILNWANYTDSMVIYRAYKVSLIKDLELAEPKWYKTPEWLFSTTLSWEPIMSSRAAWRKMKVCEIPGDEPMRVGGVRKLQVWRWGAGFLFQWFRDLIYFR
jgi:glycosyltransferase involved in cell wall biosynthesis